MPEEEDCTKYDCWRPNSLLFRSAQRNEKQDALSQAKYWFDRLKLTNGGTKTL